MNKSLSPTTRILTITVSITSSVVTAELVQYWSIALGVLLIITARVLDIQQKQRPTLALELFVLFAELHGCGILIVNYLVFLKGFEVSGHQTLANIFAISLPLIFYLLIKGCLYCLGGNRPAFRKNIQEKSAKNETSE